MSYSEKNLAFSEVVAFAASAPATLTLIPQDPDILSCVICQEFRYNGMLVHARCGRFICVACTLRLLEEGQGTNIDCPACRGNLASSPFLSQSSETSLRKPSLGERRLADLIEYRCEQCSNSGLNYELARSHRCSNVKIHQPPAHLNIEPRQPATERVEIISNPAATAPSSSRDKLLIIHFNGQQVLSRFFPASRTIAQVVAKVADFLHQPDTSTWKVFKFVHLEPEVSTRVRDVATSEGVTHLSIFSDKPNLSQSTANLLFEGVGPPPVVPRASSPPPLDFGADWGTGWDVEEEEWGNPWDPQRTSRRFITEEFWD